MRNREVEIYFDEPRLKMTLAGRLFVRVCVYAGNAVLIVAAALFLSEDVPELKAAGALLTLFLLDRFRTFNHAERFLTRLPVGRINAARYIPPSSYAAIEWAADRSIFAGGNVYLYLLKKLASRKEIAEGLLRMDIAVVDLESQIEKIASASGNIKETKDVILGKIGILVGKAFDEAMQTSSAEIEPKDFFAALDNLGDPDLDKIFQFFDVDKGDLESALLASRFRSSFSGLTRMPASLVGLMSRPHRSRHRIMNRAWTARPTPFLDQFSRDLTDLARSEQVGFLIGHANEYDRLVDVLARPGRPNALLIGEAGSGKSTLVAHLAFEMIKDRVPAPLFDKRLVELEIGSLVSGAADEELQNRVNRIINEIVLAGNIILYIPDMHNLARTSGQGKMNAADILLPAIKGDAFSVIGATSPREFKQYLEASSDLVSGFENIKVQEISEAEAVQFLVYESLILEREFKTVISFSALKEATKLAHQYFRDKMLPASAEDLLKESLADSVSKKKKILTAEDVVAVAEKKVNVPIHKAGKAEAEQLLNLEELIHERMVDQVEAVGAVARSLREYRSGLSRKGGPIATFLFVGPTGVGKTELSKILAKVQFGSKEEMIRLDMSEYQEKSSISRLIGSADGGVSGVLTGAIAEKPYSLILLDEFEKAHPDILNLFLQVFDDGRLTDSVGRTMDFQNTIIIATSNANSEFIKTQIEAGVAVKEISEQLKKKLTEHFKPELLNRFSGIVVFKPLSPEDIAAITVIQLGDLAATLRENQGIDLSFDSAVISEIARLGYDPVFGARPLRGVISEKLKGVLSEKILKGEVKKGDNIKIDFKSERFEIVKS
ncbi:MAG: ATP-dependent Clp protease ATP-binding subunit [bacterium]|nr:ATP-dependent Clp protease ATP-binding subunit [bacterium]